MKKVGTDPRGLAKSKSPSTSSSSGNRWFTGPDDDPDLMTSTPHAAGVASYAHHLASSELFPPIPSHEETSSHNGSGLLTTGDGFDAEACLSDEPDGRSGVIDREQTRAVQERLQAKIVRIMEQIKVEQNAKEENVNEYLRLSTMDDTNVDRQQAHRVKAAFEKRNQKSTQTIAQLQRKLEAYTRRLRDVKLQGVTSSRQGLRPAKTVLKDVGHGIRSMVSKPKEFAHLLRDKFGSADNINTLGDDHGESPEMKSHGSKHVRKTSGTLPNDFKYHSEENVSSAAAVTDPLPPVHSVPQCSPQFGMSATSHHSRQLQPSPQPVPAAHVDDHQSQLSDHMSDPQVMSLVHQLKHERDLQTELHDAICYLEGQLSNHRSAFQQILDEERMRREHLEEQFNDMMELHQHEVTNIKQELSSLEEKMEYQLEERTRDMQDVLESCQTKITKMELQQQQQQLISMEGLDGSTVRVLVSRLINVVLALLAVILVFVHTGIHLLGPLLNTRTRCLCLMIGIAIGVIVWQYRAAVSAYTGISVLSPASSSTDT